MLAELIKLAAGATACPGKVARSLGTTQRELRPVLVGLARTRKIVVTQGGVAADLETLRGPYRVALRPGHLRP